jgi:hypothetical protein
LGKSGKKVEKVREVEKGREKGRTDVWSGGSGFLVSDRGEFQSVEGRRVGQEWMVCKG